MPRISIENDEPEAPEIKRAAVTVADFLRVFPVGRTRAYEALRKGEIRSVRVAGRLLIPQTEIDRLLAGRGDEEGAA